jgi:ATP/maltotriose-dependent transcriptional regulator MalT/DNA-binding SARP family transcriptional activator
MPSSPPIAKVTCPASTGYLRRPRLYDLLDKARKTPVLWITGPPGCGKTALVSSYIQSRGLPCLWYKVDEADTDLSSFFYYLGLAAARASPRKRKRLPLLTPERMPGVTVFSQRYFEDLSSVVPVPSLLVLDDCHRLPEDSAFFDILRHGIERLAPGIGTVLISRSDPHPSFARHRANRLLTTLGWEDLRLTQEETAGIVQLQRNEGASAELVRDLFERTDGWAAGVVLLLTGTDRGNVTPPTIGRQVSGEIIDYFGSEVFQRLDAERQDFLLRTAVLPRMTASMAEQLTGVERASQILSEMSRLNQFTKRYSQQDPVYEYHDLFREFLLQQATTSYSRQQLDEIRRAAAALLEKAGCVEDAAVLCRQTGDWEALSRLILSRASSLVSQGRNQTVLEWLGTLPDDVLAENPWLRYWQGVCLLPFSPAESRALFAQTLQKFDVRRDATGVFRSWAGAVESIITAADDYAPLDQWIGLLPALLETYGGLPSDETGDEVTCWMARALSHRQYPRDEVTSWTTRAIALAQTTTDQRLKFLLTLVILVSFQITKDTREAGRLFGALREALKSPDATPLMRLSVDTLEAVCLELEARHEQCLQVATAGLAFAADTGVHLLDSFLQAYGAGAALKLGDVETANGLLNRMAAGLGGMKPLPLGLYHGIIGSEALVRGDLSRAASHAQEALRLWQECGFTTHLPGALALAARVHLALHEDDQAFRLLAEAQRIGGEIEQSYGVWISDLNEAYFHLQRDDDPAAMVALQKGLRLGREVGLFGELFLATEMLQEVSAKALQEGIEVEYVREVIRRNRLVPDPSNPDLEQWPWPVKVYTLGRFGLLVNEQPIEVGRKAKQRPLALLKALIALGGREVPIARLADLLWPEADGDMAHHAFEVVLGRLRTLLGKTDALVLKEGRLSLATASCWVDAWSFERCVGQANKAQREDDPVEAARRYEEALTLYRGPFLHFDETPWALLPREKLRTRFLRSVARLGEAHEEAGRWTDAIFCYERGLEADELAEEFYRRLMVCHARRGRVAEALSVYQRCRQILSSVLGVTPSPETQAVATSLGHPPS